MEQYLYHHGILGQKWGVRRFQNEDGTLTSRGKKRYQNDDGTLTDYGRKKTKGSIFNPERHYLNGRAKRKPLNQARAARDVENYGTGLDTKVFTAAKGYARARVRGYVGSALLVAGSLAVSSAVLSDRKIRGRIKTAAAITVIGKASAAAVSVGSIIRGVSDASVRVKEVNRIDRIQNK